MKNNNSVYEINCNIDDMTGEEIGYLIEKFDNPKILDFWIINYIGKKNRPGFTINILTKKEYFNDIVNLLIKYSSSSGLRYIEKKRIIMEREFKTFETEYGKISVKIFKKNNIKKFKFEYNDLKKISDNYNISTKELEKILINILLKKIELQ